MLYNTGAKLVARLPEISQEEIYNCPYYFGLSTEQIRKHGAPEFLLKLLDSFPWSDRPNVCQIRPQDFRRAHIPVDGHWYHCDNNVRLKNGSVSSTRNIHDFRLLTCSFGGVCGTELITTPWEMPDWILHPDEAAAAQAQHMKNPFTTFTTGTGEVVEYTSADFHRASPKVKVGAMRLFMVMFESDDVRGSEWIIHSIREREISGAQ